ncbi:hypothetical protein Taro_047129 [Colocasia esculenta]|uniref:RING-type domain-containing protein n=1 Tax=Colocasia esculenta TaxID=4460 RepID=A0A843X7S8_COLES|nr:hypothetical protein [Colocasia esculenta]
MSISPTDGQRSVPSSSCAPPRSPGSHHGSPREHRRSLEIGAGRPLAGSPHIAAPEGMAATAGNAVMAVSVSGESDSSSEQMTELRTQDVKKVSCARHSGTIAQWQPSGEGIATPQTRSDQRRLTQFRGKQPGHADTSVCLHNSVNHSGGRRNQGISGNHLLNFHFDPISRPQPRMTPSKRQQKIRPYNKDLFLQANYNFFVLDTGNYVVGSMNPDKMLHWEDVVCVRYSTPFNVQCPICLENPMSAQITSCGHIYCFPCILRYLLMGEEDHQGEYWKKCPLCFMMLSVKDLYTVNIHNVKPYNVGDHIDFTLLTRSKDSTVPLQRNYQKLGSVPCGSDELCDSFSKFTLTSDVELSAREGKKDLSDWLAKAESGLVDDLERLPYVCAALDQLDQRIKNWADYQSLSCSPASRSAFPNSTVLSATSDKIQPCTSSTTVNREQIFFGVSESAVRKQSTSQEEMPNSSAIDEQTHLLPPFHVAEHSEGLEKLSPSYGNKALQKHPFDANERDSYFFYQAIDGQHLILHPLNMKCLLHHYKSYDSLPDSIGGQIIQLETVTQSEAARKRYRFLSHFSLTTSFQLCEIDLSHILPADALSLFIDEIKKREKQRKRLAMKEQEEKDRAEAAALHAMPVPSDYRRSSYGAAAYSLEEFEALGNSAPPSTSPPTVGERKRFSDVTRLGYASGHDSPALRANELGDVPGNTEVTGEASNVGGQRTTPLSFASVMSASKAVSSLEVPKADGLGKKGKKPTRVLLSTAGGRRY